MNEEEKQAIEYWKRDIALYHCNTQLASEYYAQIILNLIEKQQKELDQEKEKNKNLIKQLQEQNTEIQDISKQLREKEQEDIKMRAKFVLSLDEYILKDKIREFIKKETFKGTYSFDLISAKRLIELLEEN